MLVLRTLPQEQLGGLEVLGVVRQGKVMEVGGSLGLDLGLGGAVVTGEEILMPPLLGLVVVDVVVDAVEVIRVGIGIGIGIETGIWIGRIVFRHREGTIRLLRGAVVVGALEGEEIIGTRALAREAHREGGIVMINSYTQWTILMLLYCSQVLRLLFRAYGLIFNSTPTNSFFLVAHSS